MINERDDCWLCGHYFGEEEETELIWVRFSGWEKTCVVCDDDGRWVDTYYGGYYDNSIKEVNE